MVFRGLPRDTLEPRNRELLTSLASIAIIVFCAPLFVYWMRVTAALIAENQPDSPRPFDWNSPHLSL
jgi:hypothetical protein